MTENRSEIILKRTEIADLEYFFQFQLNKEARYMAAFTPKNSADKTAYLEKYTKLIKTPTVNNFTIVLDGVIVGSVAKFVMEGNSEITYWIDKKYWGKGIASYALKHFLEMEDNRPIFARVAFDNFGSQKVLEKCGFVKIDTDSGYAEARQMEIEEFIYKLG